MKRFKISMEIMADVEVEAETQAEAFQKAKEKIGELHGDVIWDDVTILTDAPIKMKVLSETDA